MATKARAARKDEASDTDLLRRMIEHLARPQRQAKAYGVPLWSVVGDFLGLGSTSSTELCVRLGLDPHLKVLEPDWVDMATEVVLDFCPHCMATFDRGEGADHVKHCEFASDDS